MRWWNKLVKNLKGRSILIENILVSELKKYP
jgi:hypothetical protein